jgi:GNAT superfamily N-acetyltransferase
MLGRRRKYRSQVENLWRVRGRVGLAETMRIEQWDPSDEKTARACYDVALAAHQADGVVEPLESYGIFALNFREGWNRTPGETWVAFDGDGTAVGFCRMTLPDLENRDEASGGPVVHPALRRRGIGRALLRHEGTRSRAYGRTRFGAQAIAGSAGDAFALAVGARLDLEEARRIQHLREIGPSMIASLRASAEKAAAGYSLVSWAGATPEEYLAPVAEVFSAINDAPHGANEEPEVWDAARVRDREDVLVRAGLARSHSVAALADATGEMAAYSAVTLDPESPSWGYQQLTAVLKAHRGHRLGMLAKTAMLELLASAEPQLEFISTGNAATNKHMIAINEQLGYRLAEHSWHFYEIPVADIR